MYISWRCRLKIVSSIPALGTIISRMTCGVYSFLSEHNQNDKCIILSASAEVHIKINLSN